MIHQTSLVAVAIFAAFVLGVLGLSFWLGRKGQSASGYYAAHGQIHWFVNGIAFAGDYLSAASFLGICGMIAFSGYDGFLYSIGFLAGWIVALFVIAEPIKALGKFTFADALDSRFNSRGIKLAVAISTLVVSIFYLIPQMVGAGSLIKPLLGLPHEAGVVLVGVTVTLIVVTAGMVSTTWVQFIKGSLLVFFCGVLTALILGRGLTVNAGREGAENLAPQVRTVKPDGTVLVDGRPQSKDHDLRPVGTIIRLPERFGAARSTGPLGPLEYLAALEDSTIVTWAPKKHADADGVHTTFAPVEKKGADLLKPGGSFKGLTTGNLADRLDFASLMLALFCGTASLPHILIRYYTVKDAAAARKSTVVGIAAIGVFYVLTLFLGLGAMTSGALDPTDTNMAAPLLAKTFSDTLFAVISAIAFTTVLGTVSGLIIDDRPREDPRRQARGRGPGDRGHGPRHPVSKLQCQLPRGLGLQHRRECQPSRSGDAAVLAADHAAGDHRGRHGGYAGVARVDPALGRHVREGLRAPAGQRAHALQPARTGDDPPGIPRARRGLAAHAIRRRTLHFPPLARCPARSPPRRVAR